MPTADQTSVIPRVSASLRSLICAYVPLLASEADVVFDSPGDLDGSKENRLSLYLYQIELNPYLRNSPPMLSVEQGEPARLASLTSRPAPLAVDLMYMAVSFGKTAEIEQIIASGVVNILDTCGYLPREYVDPMLEETGNGRLKIIPQSSSIHVLRDLWAAFPQKSYHLTKLYTVSDVRIPSPSKFSADMMVEMHEGGK
jgi:hypothetical protein